jgi:hypothetical protein
MYYSISSLVGGDKEDIESRRHTYYVISMLSEGAHEMFLSFHGFI